MTDDEGGLDALGEPREVEARRAGWPRVLVALALASLGLAGLVVGGGWALSGVAQTEAGLCRVTPVPCTSLSILTVARLSGVDLPVTTEVLDAYHHNTAEKVEFRAVVRLPDVDWDPLVTSEYEPFDGDFTLFFEAPGFELADLRMLAVPSSDGLDYRVAAVGTDPEGRTIMLFASHELTAD